MRNKHLAETKKTAFTTTNTTTSTTTRSITFDMKSRFSRRALITRKDNKKSFNPYYPAAISRQEALFSEAQRRRLQEAGRLARQRTLVGGV